MEPSSGRQQHNPRCLKYRAYGAERKERKGRGGIKKRKWAKKRNDVESWQLSHGTRLWEKEEKKRENHRRSLWKKTGSPSTITFELRAGPNKTRLFFSFLCVHVSLSQGRALHTARSFFLSFFSVFPPGDKQTPPSAIRRRRERELFHILFCMCQRCCPHTLYLLRNVARGQLL